MENSERQFFHENDKRINNMVCKILLWLTLVFRCCFCCLSSEYSS